MKQNKKAIPVITIILVAVICFGILEFGSYLYFKGSLNSYPAIYEKAQNGLAVSVKKNYSQKWEQPEFNITIKTNNIGLRENKDWNGEKIDIGFYGDSFTFGHGVNFGERYSDVLRKYFPNKNIVSFSYLNGWTIPHYYVFLKNYPELMPDTAIIGLFLGNDLTCDIEETGFIKDAQGDLVGVTALKRAVEPSGWLTYRYEKYDFLRYFWFGKLLLKLRQVAFMPGINSPNILSYDQGKLNQSSYEGLHYLKQMNDYLKIRNKRCVVFIIPWSFYVGDYPAPYEKSIAEDLRKNQYLTEKIVQWCLDNNVECINPVSQFKKMEANGIRLYFNQDAHWNKQGHAAAAKIIADYLMQD
jgi:hypothetical protein